MYVCTDLCFMPEFEILLIELLIERNSTPRLFNFKNIVTLGHLSMRN